MPEPTLVIAVIRTNGVVEIGQHEDDTVWIRDQIGGWLEALRIPAALDCIAYINEDGKRLKLPFNPVATALIRPPGDVILGNAVVVGSAPPEHIDLTDAGFRAIYEVLRRLNA